MNKKFNTALLFILLSSIQFLSGQDSLRTGKYFQQNWGLGGMFRFASIPFETGGVKEVSTFVPLLYFENQHFFYHGLTGGFKFYQPGHWRFSAITRVHFFDIPEEYQNAILGDNLDIGLQVRYSPSQLWHLDAELMSDLNRNPLGNIRLGIKMNKYPFNFSAWTELKLKSGAYNSYYFGLNSLTGINVGWGTDISAGFILNYHLISSVYLYASAQITSLDKNSRNVSFVEDDYTWQAFLGFGLSNDRKKPARRAIKNTPYIRVAHGWASQTPIWGIVFLQYVPDSLHHQLTSVFYGYPLTDEVLGLPLDIYIAVGLAHHWPSDYQKAAWEGVFAIKAYYTIPLPIRVRPGMAEGISYISEVTYIERTEMEQRGYRPSKKLNFLDFSLDVNLGDIFGGRTMDHLWFGASIHHRSGIWGNAQQYGRIDGGSNYLSAHLQYHF